MLNTFFAMLFSLSLREVPSSSVGSIILFFPFNRRIPLMLLAENGRPLERLRDGAGLISTSTT